MSDPAEIATKIAADMISGAPFRPIGLDRDDGFAAAYTIQDAVVARLQQIGARSTVCGYKLAFNSPALLEKLNLAEPAAGRLFADQRHASPAGLTATDYHSPAIEPEIAAILAAPLGPRRGGHDRDSVKPAIARLVPAFEILDLAGVTLAAEIVADVIARNILNAGVVLGEPGCAPQDLDIGSIDMTLRENGVPVATVTGAAPQHPLDAIAWLADHLATRGRTLEAGMVILCGTHIPPRRIVAPNRVEMEMTGLGRAEFSIR